MPEVELQSTGLGAEVEVKKLQELVRKLEQQNEQLRSRAGPQLVPASPEKTLQYFLAQETEDGSQASVLDQLELLDLSSLSCWDESDETWLYASGTRPAPLDPLTPLQWCRQVLDRPRSDPAAAGPDTGIFSPVVWGRGSFSCPSPFSPSAALLQESPLRTSCSTPQFTEKQAPPLHCSPRYPTLQHALSPVRRELLPFLSERTPLPICGEGFPRQPLSPQGSVDGGLGSDVDDSMDQGFKLQDLVDVQVMARLQEESLRQDLLRASFAGRHSRSLGFLSGASGLEEEEEERGFLLQRPRLLATLLPLSRTFSSARDFRDSPPPRPHSASSTQMFGSGGWTSWDLALGPELGSGLRLDTAGLQDLSPGVDALRRSMPNLTRISSVASVPAPVPPASAPHLRNSQSFDSSAGLTPRGSSILLQNRVHSTNAAAPLSSRLSKATAYVSPTIKGSWSSAPRSSLPRPAPSPGSTSTPRRTVKQSARSILTPPKSWSPLRTPRDISRRECGY